MRHRLLPGSLSSARLFALILSPLSAASSKLTTFPIPT
jgi:hypothetical protein